MARCWPRSSPWFCSRAASVPTPGASWTLPPRQPPWACSSGGSPTSSMPSFGAVPSTVPWAMVFPDAGPLPRHPSQLYEALTEGLVLFAVLWWLTHRTQALRRPGVIGGTFLVGYGLARSFCEFFREPDAGHILTVGPFTAGMLLFPAHGSGRHSRDPRGRKALLGAGRCPALTRTARRARCWRSCARASSGRARCRSMPTCAPALPIPSTATGAARRASARAGISSRRPRSARCSAS